jgi:succinate dehydrogenase / fumarate reductase cytochrome b subunit
VLAFYRSTIGKKVIMAITGLIGIGFVILHMVGNLQIFIGPEKINAYGGLLHGPLGEVTWAVRAVLIVAVVLHVLMAWQLTRMARAARPMGYRDREPQVSTIASRTMRWGGVLLLVFIVLHILHFTTQDIDPAHVRGRTLGGYRDVYDDVALSFRIWWVTAFYVIAMVALGMHLYHGAWSSMRTLGVAKPSEHPLKRRIALVVAIVVWLGFTIVPIAVYLGAVPAAVTDQEAR